jgi:hypothetical protein
VFDSDTAGASRDSVAMVTLGVPGGITELSIKVSQQVLELLKSFQNAGMAFACFQEEQIVRKGSRIVLKKDELE